MAKIVGIEGMSYSQLVGEVQSGGKFVVFEYCISVLIMTFKRGSDIYYLKPGESALVKGLPYTLLSLALGWWGFPWGFIYTPMALITNFGGGKNVTAQVMASLTPAARPPQG
jgi:hypothetical protein